MAEEDKIEEALIDGLNQLAALGRPKEIRRILLRHLRKVSVMLDVELILEQSLDNKKEPPEGGSCDYPIKPID